MKNLPRYKDCFICGRANPCGLNITFQSDGESVIALFKPLAHHVGFKEHIHGGVLASVLDEIMGWAVCVKTKRLFNTWELTVRYTKPAQLGMSLKAVARMTADKHRYLVAEGWIEDENGEIYAKGEGKYFPLDETASEEIMNYLETEEGTPPQLSDLGG